MALQALTVTLGKTPENGKKPEAHFYCATDPQTNSLYQRCALTTADNNIKMGDKLM